MNAIQKETYSKLAYIARAYMQVSQICFTKALSEALLVDLGAAPVASPSLVLEDIESNQQS